MIWKTQVLRSDTHCAEYAKTRASSDLCFPVYNSVYMRENAGQKKPTYPHTLRSDKEEITVSDYTDFKNVKFSFFQRLIVIELLVSEMIEKIYQNSFVLKLPSYYFFFQTVSHCKSKPVTMFWKTVINKIFSKLIGKDLIRIKSFTPSQDFRQFSGKFYNGSFEEQIRTWGYKNP